MRMRRGRQFERSPRRPGSSSVEGSKRGGAWPSHAQPGADRDDCDRRAGAQGPREAGRQTGRQRAVTLVCSRIACSWMGFWECLFFAAVWHRAAVPRERGRRATLLAALHSKYRRWQAGAPAADLQQRTPQALRQDRHMPEADRRYREALKSQRPRPALASVAAQPASCSGTCAGAGRRVVPGKGTLQQHSLVSTSGDDGCCCCCVHDSVMGRRTSKRALKHVITCGAASWAAGP